MAEEKVYRIFSKQVALEVTLWLLYTLAWYRYFIIYFPATLAILKASITIIFASATFYLTRWYTESRTGQPRFTFVFVPALLLIVGSAFLRTIGMAVVQRLLLPANVKWSFMPEFGGSFLHILFFVILGFSIASYGQRNKLSKEKLEAELKYLKSQINPHFLFNVHNSIHFLIQENPDLAARVLLKLSELMRYQLYDCERDWVTIGNELRNIENYLELEQVRSEGNVNISFNKEVSDAGRVIPPFILITFVENACKHVARQNTPAGKIEINARQQNGFLHFTVRNDVDRQPDISSQSFSGIGLTNLKKRLALIYADRANLRVDHTSRYFEIELKIPLR